jgi:flagellar assembly protein FliH
MGGVIKAGQPLGGATTSDALFQFDDMGQVYLGKVRDEANRIIAAARQEAEKLRAQALDEGRQAAHKSTQAAVQAKVDEHLRSLRPALDQLMQELAQSRRQCHEQLEAQALEIAVAIAARLVRGQLQHDPTVTLRWIQEAVELASGSERIRLRLHPDDVASLGERVGVILAQVGKLARSEVVADPNVTRGGCVVETDLGIIDQQLESQLSRIDEELLSK